MTHIIKYTKTLLLALCLLAGSGSRAQQIIDQLDTSYNGGMSARTLPGYSWYQTITAGVSGNMDRIDIGFFNSISATGFLELYEGAGRAGNLIYTKHYNVNCPGGGCMIPFQVNCPIIAGSSYTFHFIPDSGFTDPYGVQVDGTNSYPGGEAYIIDPSGTYPLSADFIFRTYVKMGVTAIMDLSIKLSTWYRIEGSSIILTEGVQGELFSISGRKVKMTDTANGIYCLNLWSETEYYSTKIVIHN